MPPGDSVSQKNSHCVAGSLYGVHFCVVSYRKVFCQETRQASPCRETGDSHMQIETENKTTLQSSGVPGSLTMGDGEVAVIGIDIGSTTAKIVVFCGEAGCPAGSGRLVYSCYERHFSQVRPKTLELLRRVQPLIGNRRVRVAYPAPPGWDWHARRISRSSRRFLPPPKPCAGWSRTHPPSLNWAGRMPRSSSSTADWMNV